MRHLDLEVQILPHDVKVVLGGGAHLTHAHALAVLRVAVPVGSGREQSATSVRQLVTKEGQSRPQDVPALLHDSVGTDVAGAIDPGALQVVPLVDGDAQGEDVLSQSTRALIPHQLHLTQTQD